MVAEHKRSGFAFLAGVFFAIGVFMWIVAPDDLSTLTIGKDYQHKTLVFLYNRNFDFPTGEAFVIDIPLTPLVTFGLAGLFYWLDTWKRRRQPSDLHGQQT